MCWKCPGSGRGARSHSGVDRCRHVAISCAAGVAASLVPRTRIERLVKGDTALMVDTALRLSTLFGNTPEFWINLQRSYDLARDRESVDVSDIVPLVAA